MTQQEFKQHLLAWFASEGVTQEPENVQGSGTMVEGFVPSDRLKFYGANGMNAEIVLALTSQTTPEPILLFVKYCMGMEQKYAVPFATFIKPAEPPPIEGDKFLGDPIAPITVAQYPWIDQARKYWACKVSGVGDGFIHPSGNYITICPRFMMCWFRER